MLVQCSELITSKILYLTRFRLIAQDVKLSDPATGESITLDNYESFNDYELKYVIWYFYSKYLLIC